MVRRAGQTVSRGVSSLLFFVVGVSCGGEPDRDRERVAYSSVSPSLSFDVTDLGAGFDAIAINGSGVVVGNGDGGPLIWENGILRTLNSQTPFDRATAINGAGVVAGRSFDPSDLDASRAAIWESSTGSITVLTTLPGEARDINDARVVVGRGYPTGTPGGEAIVWREIGNPPTWQAQSLGNSAAVYRINNADQIAGTAVFAGGQQHAALWSGGTLTDVGVLPGGYLSYAESINEVGQVVGESYGPPHGYPTAFLWHNGTMTSLGTLGGVYSVAFDINASAHIVGIAADNAMQERPVLWRDGVMSDLNALIPLGLGWDLTRALAINDADWIVGTGVLNGEEHGFLLIPSAPPVACGDGVLQTGEGCDDGNNVTEACSYGLMGCTICDSGCQSASGITSYCGDARTDASKGEGCDDGNNVSEVCSYGLMNCTICNSTCQTAAGATSYCGDGRREIGYEQCDDGNKLNADGCSASCVVEVAAVVMAAFDAQLRTPTCAALSASCDTGGLVVGRGTMSLGIEPNQPNTRTTCADGSYGRFHVDESVDRLVVASLDGSALKRGASARITATVWAWGSGTSDYLDLYYAADAANPVWTIMGTIRGNAVPTGRGALQTLTRQYVVPASGSSTQAIRAQWRYNGAASSCTSGPYNDRDDLVFTVQ